MSQCDKRFNSRKSHEGNWKIINLIESELDENVNRNNIFNNNQNT